MRDDHVGSRVVVVSVVLRVVGGRCMPEQIPVAVATHRDVDAEGPWSIELRLDVEAGVVAAH